MQAELEALAVTLQDIQKQMAAMSSNRQVLISQLNENTITKEELELLDNQAQVFKQVGPTLCKIEKQEAYETVTKRLQFIGEQIATTERELKQKGAEAEAKRAQAIKLQGALQQQRIKQQQALAAAQQADVEQDEEPTAAAK